MRTPRTRPRTARAGEGRQCAARLDDDQFTAARRVEVYLLLDDDQFASIYDIPTEATTA